LLRRQASEQYLTASQCFAQRRRQLIIKPQTAHGLPGKARLLPRKSDLRSVIDLINVIRVINAPGARPGSSEAIEVSLFVLDK
jgi:hypothetical protein